MNAHNAAKQICKWYKLKNYALIGAYHSTDDKIMDLFTCSDSSWSQVMLLTYPCTEHANMVYIHACIQGK